jgi:putative transposase
MGQTEPRAFRPGDRSARALLESTAMGHPMRLARARYFGEQPVFLTICTAGRRRLFTQPTWVAGATSQILHCCADRQFAVVAYCFMPDHLHALVVGTAAHADLAALVKSAKQATGYAFRQQTGEVLWQPSYFDRTIRGHEDQADVIRYIVTNPVRAGLVDSVEDYPYWGSTVYSRARILEFVSEGRRVDFDPSAPPRT